MTAAGACSPHSLKPNKRCPLWPRVRSATGFHFHLAPMLLNAIGFQGGGKVQCLKCSLMNQGPNPMSAGTLSLRLTPKRLG